MHDDLISEPELRSNLRSDWAAGSLTAVVPDVRHAEFLGLPQPFLVSTPPRRFGRDIRIRAFFKLAIKFRLTFF